MKVGTGECEHKEEGMERGSDAMSKGKVEEKGGRQEGRVGRWSAE